MAVSSLSFSAQIDDWVRGSEARMTAVFRESCQTVAPKSTARIPVDLGFARASIRGSTKSMPPIDPSFDNKEKQQIDAGFALNDITMVIATAKIGDTVYLGYTAAYALALEHGHSKQAPLGFVGITALEWPRIVQEVSQELKARAGAA